MDPASAAVAAVGFAGSLVALFEVVTDTSRAVHGLLGKLREASTDAKRLLGILRTLEVLADKIKHYNEADEFPKAMQELWRDRAALMLQDLEGLKGIVKKLEESGQGKSYSQKHFRMRMQKVFADDKIKLYERNLSSHVQTFNFALSMVSE